MSIATLNILPDARSSSAEGDFRFLAVTLPQSGMVLDRSIAVEEDLVTPGINNQRWLHLFTQFPVTEATTIIDCQTYNAAITLARKHNLSTGRFGDLTMMYGSLTISYRKVKIASSSAVARLGAVTGFGVTGSPLASVITRWRWQCTEEGSR